MKKRIIFVFLLFFMFLGVVNAATGVKPVFTSIDNYGGNKIKYVGGFDKKGDIEAYVGTGWDGESGLYVFDDQELLIHINDSANRRYNAVVLLDDYVVVYGTQGDYHFSADDAITFMEAYDETGSLVASKDWSEPCPVVRGDPEVPCTTTGVYGRISYAGDNMMVLGGYTDAYYSEELFEGQSHRYMYDLLEIVDGEIEFVSDDQYTTYDELISNKPSSVAGSEVITISDEYTLIVGNNSLIASEGENIVESFVLYKNGEMVFNKAMEGLEYDGHKYVNDAAILDNHIVVLLKTGEDRDYVLVYDLQGNFISSESVSAGYTDRVVGSDNLYLYNTAVELKAAIHYTVDVDFAGPGYYETKIVGYEGLNGYVADILSYVYPSDTVKFIIYHDDDVPLKEASIDGEAMTCATDEGQSICTFLMPESSVEVRIRLEEDAPQKGILVPFNQYTTSKIKYVSGFDKKNDIEAYVGTSPNGNRGLYVYDGDQFLWSNEEDEYKAVVLLDNYVIAYNTVGDYLNNFNDEINAFDVYDMYGNLVDTMGWGAPCGDPTEPCTSTGVRANVINVGDNTFAFVYYNDIAYIENVASGELHRRGFDLVRVTENGFVDVEDDEITAFDRLLMNNLTDIPYFHAFAENGGVRAVFGDNRMFETERKTALKVYDGNTLLFEVDNVPKYGDNTEVKSIALLDRYVVMLANVPRMGDYYYVFTYGGDYVSRIQIGNETDRLVGGKDRILFNSMTSMLTDVHYTFDVHQTGECENCILYTLPNEDIAGDYDDVIDYIAPGDDVMLIINPDAGVELDSVAMNETPIECEDILGMNEFYCSFVMPEDNFTLNVVFTKTEQPVETIAVYRLYNPYNAEHLYTTDANEVEVLYTEHGWGKEGIGWYTTEEGTPIYRLYNPGLGNHLYTSDENEIEVLTTEHGWVKDNNGEPVMYSTGNENDIPIYRVYNESLSGMHHLTTDENEYNVLPEYGWEQEGISMYAAKIGAPETTHYYNEQ